MDIAVNREAFVSTLGRIRDTPDFEAFNAQKATHPAATGISHDLCAI